MFLYILALEVWIFWFFRDAIVSMMTSIKELRSCIYDMYPILIANIIIAGVTGALRGPIYALGLMRQLTIWNFIFQGVLMPILLYNFLYVNKFGMTGIWMVKLITESGLFISYSLTLIFSDWHRIAYEFMRKRVRDSS